MSTPFVTGQREQTVESIISEMDELSREMEDWALKTVRHDLDRQSPPDPPDPNMVYLDKLRIFSGNKANNISAGLLRFDLSGRRLKNSHDFYLIGDSGRSFKLDRIKAELDGQGSINRVEFMIPPRMKAPEGTYYLFAAPGRQTMEKTAGPNKSNFTLKNEHLEIQLSPDGVISGVSHNGRPRLKAGSLIPSVRYRFNNGIIDCRPQKVSVSTSKNGPSPSLDISGVLSLPDRISVKPGRFAYHLTLIKGMPLLLVQGEITYPQTRKWKTISGGHARLMKRYDPNWYEVAPLELIWAPAAAMDTPFKIIKRNYLGVESSYLLDYYRHSPDNLDLADINNHITAEYAGVVAPGAGLAVAMDTSQLASFAFCPMKMNCKPQAGLGIRLNPFGTYFGRQYKPPTWGNSHGYEAAVTAGGQYQSSAPSYNGHTQRFSVMIAFFDEDQIPEQIKAGLIGFAHPPMVVTGGRIKTWDPSDQRSEDLGPPQGLLAASAEKKVYIHWDKSRDRTVRYKVFYGPGSGAYTHEYVTAGRSLVLEDLQPGKKYYTAICGLDKNGRQSPLSSEITFVAGDEPQKPEIELPLSFQLKLLWTGLMESLERNFL